MPKTIARHRKGRDSYLELVTEVSLVRIRSAAQYDAAVDMVRKLSVRGEENLDPGAREYLEMLLLSVGEYEDRRHRVELSGLTPVGVLKHLMAANHMKGRDLAEILGSQSTASMILTGARGISKAQAKKLARRFKVDVGLFL